MEMIPLLLLTRECTRIICVNTKLKIPYKCKISPKTISLIAIIGKGSIYDHQSVKMHWVPNRCSREGKEIWQDHENLKRCLRLSICNNCIEASLHSLEVLLAEDQTGGSHFRKCKTSEEINLMDRKHRRGRTLSCFDKLVGQWRTRRRSYACRIESNLHEERASGVSCSLMHLRHATLLRHHKHVWIRTSMRDDSMGKVCRWKVTSTPEQTKLSSWPDRRRFVMEFSRWLVWKSKLQPKLRIILKNQNLLIFGAVKSLS